MKRVAVTFAIAIVWANAAHAAASSVHLHGVYTGTIANASVVVEFGSPGADTPDTGVYFYLAHAAPIAIASDVMAEDVRVREFSKSDDPSTKGPLAATWRLQRVGDTLRGTWTNVTSGKTYAISLRRVGDATQAKASPLVGDPEHAAATYRALFAYPKTLGPLRRPQPYIAMQTVTDERIGIATVDITTFAPETVRERADATLASNFDERRMLAIDCLSNDSRMTDYRETMRVAFVSKRALSIAIGAEFFCGGAHPGDALQPITIDLRDGSAVPWNRAIADHPAAERRYARELPKAIADPELRAQCTDPNLSADDYAYSLAPGGLAIRASYPHVASACDVEVIVPSSEARAFVAPGYRALLP